MYTRAAKKMEAALLNYETAIRLDPGQEGGLVRGVEACRAYLEAGK